MCTGSAPPNLTVLATLSVQWQLGGAELTNSTLEGVSVTNSDLMATLIFSSLDNDTHERDYVCVATLSITNVPITRNSSTTYTLMTLSKFSCHNYCFIQLLSYQYRQSHCLHIFKWFYYCWYYIYIGVYCHYCSWSS